MRQRGPLSAAQLWVAENLVAEGYRAFTSAYELLRYEDIVARPQAVLRPPLDAVGNPAGELPFIDDATVRLRANHSVSGNPVRFTQDELPIAEYDEWRTAMAWHRTMAVAGLTWPLLVRCGYL